MKLMQSKRVQMSVVLSVVMVLLGFSLQAHATGVEESICECPRVCENTDVALELLDSGYVLIEKVGLYKRCKGRLELRRAKIKIVRAKIALANCELSDLGLGELLGTMSGMPVDEVIEMIKTMLPVLPAMLKDMIGSMLEGAPEDIKVEMLLTASILAIDHAIIETYDGLLDRDALNNIMIAKKLLLIVQEIMSCETCPVG